MFEEATCPPWCTPCLPGHIWEPGAQGASQSPCPGDEKGSAGPGAASGRTVRPLPMRPGHQQRPVLLPEGQEGAEALSGQNGGKRLGPWGRTRQPRAATRVTVPRRGGQGECAVSGACWDLVDLLTRPGGEPAQGKHTSGPCWVPSGCPLPRLLTWACGLLWAARGRKKGGSNPQASAQPIGASADTEAKPHPGQREDGHLGPVWVGGREGPRSCAQAWEQLGPEEP